METERQLIGKKVLVRTKNAGVFYGTLKEKEAQTAAISNARVIWFWKGACSLMQLAQEGVKNKKESKFTMSVETVVVEGVIQIIPCTEKAIENIESVEIWKI